jgi:ABC-type nitrate/sulfonate/bicarbonate transport system permease component
LDSTSVYTSHSQLEREKLSKTKILYKKNENFILGTISVTVFLLFWELSVLLGWIDPLFISSPSRILSTGFLLFLDGAIYNDLRVSGIEFGIGFGLAIIVAIPLGILMGWYPKISAIFDPFVAALYATPRIALLPLLMIWFGIGLGSKIAIIFLGSIFPILVNTITGMRTIDADYIKAARSFGAKDKQIFLTVALPSSIPLILTGIRLGLGHALIGVVVGELYAATAGIGFMMAVAGSTFQTDKLMVGIIIIAIAGVAMTEIIRKLEKRFDRWRPQNNKG